MEMTEDQIIEKYAKRCGHCNRNTLLPYEYEFTCFSCGYNVNKRKHELSKIQRKKINFINRLKYAEVKIFSICVDLYKIYDGDDFSEIFKILSTLKNKKLKINNILIEKYKDMLLNPNFEQNCWSKTAIGIYKIGHDSIRLMKWICYYDRSYYENINYYDLMGSLCKYLISHNYSYTNVDYYYNCMNKLTWI